MADNLAFAPKFVRLPRGFLSRDGQTKERLLIAENARLRRLCAEHSTIVAGHALALREGDHRIKNSLQIVASLMAIQERRETNNVARAALRAATSRIRAIAEIHNALNLGSGDNRLNLGAVLETMCRSLHAMAGDGRLTVVEVDAVSVEAPIDVAQPLIVAVNELLVNALRHAFPDHHSGSVKLSSSVADGELKVVVADDGVGLPLGYRNGGGYGLRLVRAMVDQMGASLTIEGGGGARFTIGVPEELLLNRPGSSTRP
jgi:two-component sensor histidine kinase